MNSITSHPICTTAGQIKQILSEERTAKICRNSVFKTDDCFDGLITAWKGQFRPVTTHLQTLTHSPQCQMKPHQGISRWARPPHSPQRPLSQTHRLRPQPTPDFKMTPTPPPSRRRRLALALALTLALTASNIPAPRPSRPRWP